MFTGMTPTAFFIITKELPQIRAAQNKAALGNHDFRPFAVPYPGSAIK
jgi:hypothetical protein